ncbi:MAG: hypothetical protein EP343_14995 [Deltaproteobacteria bacterium]|nr:MAG: hypothetical protein EP343_14995 [Deltaproteobacteria bacterium]
MKSVVSTNSCWLWGVVLIGFFGFGMVGGSRVAEAATSNCKTLYKQRKFIKASRCFFALAKPFLSQPSLGANKGRVGFHVLNAAISLRKAANASPLPAFQSYLWEQVIGYLRLYLSRKLYESDSQKRVAVVLKNEMFRKIGYARLTITTPNKQVQILVLGYRFEGKGKGLWSQDVRPGRYSIVATAPGQTPVTRTLTITPREPLVLAFLERDLGILPVERRQAPAPPPPVTVSYTASYVLLGLGGVLAIGSAICFGVALDSRTSAEKLLREELDKPSTERLFGNTRKVKELETTANSLTIGGWVFAGAAFAAVVVGGSLFLRPAPAPPRTRTQVAPAVRSQASMVLGRFQ